jgi:transcriptional regulator with XRE-family HTH domain
LSTADNRQERFIGLVGRRVRARREAAGITQSQLERDAGLQPASIAGLERGEQDVEMYDLHRVAGVLGVDLRELLPADEEPGE